MSIEKCDICGKEFEPTYTYCYVCNECRKDFTKNQAMKDRYSERQRELVIRANAEERAKKNDRIVGEGYAERQIAESLRLAGKVKTEL